MERAIIRQCILERSPFPDAIKNAPVLAPGLVFYYMAYQEIATCREYNQAGPVPISWKLIHDWCAAYRCDDEMEEDVIHHVMKMDEAQREWMKKRKTLGSKDGHQPPQPAHPKATRKNRRGR